VQGDTGAAGPQGVAGGISGLEIVSGTHPYNSGLINASLDCPAGKVAIAGAYDLRLTNTDAHGPRVVMSRRDPLNAQRWLWIVSVEFAFELEFEIEVVCVGGS
jgi:hypothetical protein